MECAEIVKCLHKFLIWLLTIFVRIFSIFIFLIHIYILLLWLFLFCDRRFPLRDELLE